MIALVVASERYPWMPPWLPVVVLVAWCGLGMRAIVRDVRRSRKEGSAWSATLRSAVCSRARRASTADAKIILGMVVGYGALIVVASRRWPAAAFGLAVLPLLVLGFVSYRQLGRQISDRERRSSEAE